jgi:hypothetical protein
MGDVISTVAQPLVDVAEDALKLVEDPISAVLPETEAIFTDLSKMLTSGSKTSDPRLEADRSEAQGLAQELPRLRGESKQEAMVKMVHLLLNALA